jgi:hypothetical protein
MNSFADPTFTMTIPEGPRGIPKIFLIVPDYGVTVPLKLGRIDTMHKTAEKRRCDRNPRAAPK